MNTALHRVLYDSEEHGTTTGSSQNIAGAAMTGQNGLQASEIVVLVLFVAMGIIIVTIGILEIRRMVQSNPVSDDEDSDEQFEWKDLEASPDGDARYKIGKIFELSRVQCKLSEEDFITPTKELNTSYAHEDPPTTLDSTTATESSPSRCSQQENDGDTKTETKVASTIGARVMLPPRNAQSFLYKGITVKNIAARRLAENCCAICLETYSPGDQVVWSENSKCNHLFHKHCMLDYFVSLQSTSKPCPTCRQDFCMLFWY